MLLKDWLGSPGEKQQWLGGGAGTAGIGDKEGAEGEGSLGADDAEWAEGLLGHLQGPLPVICVHVRASS